MAKDTMSAEAREALNAYKREWNRNNPEKRRAQQRRYWERKAQEKREQLKAVAVKITQDKRKAEQ